MHEQGDGWHGTMRVPVDGSNKQQAIVSDGRGAARTCVDKVQHGGHDQAWIARGATV